MLRAHKAQVRTASYISKGPVPTSMSSPGATARPSSGSRAAQVFVLVAVVAMLIGVSLVLLAREPYLLDLEPGQREEVFTLTVPDWDPMGHQIEGRFHGPANMTVNFTVTGETHYDQAGGTYAGYNVTNWTTDDGAPARSFVATPSPGERRVWSTDLEAVSGETWTLTVENTGNDTARFQASVISELMRAAGLVGVGIGVLGFIAYRLGMGRSDD